MTNDFLYSGFRKDADGYVHRLMKNRLLRKGKKKHVTTPVQGKKVCVQQETFALFTQVSVRLLPWRMFALF